MNTTYLFSNWQSADSETKVSLLSEIISYLGNDWKIDGEQLIHKPSEKQFAFIPAGWMTQGLSPEKIQQACERRKYFDFEKSSWLMEVKKMRPSKDVWVYPFLMSVEPEDKKTNINAKYDFDFPSEAEIEWVFSNGGQTNWVAENNKPVKKKKATVNEMYTSPFGIPELQEKEIQCIDNWHETLHEKPETSVPWGNDCETGKDVHTTWQDAEEEQIAWHVAYREKSSSSKDHYSVIRLNELFDGIARNPLQPDNSFIKDILENGKGKEKKALLGTMELLGHFPAEDTFEILQLLLDNLKTDWKLTVKLLKAIALMVNGPSEEERLNYNTKFSEDRKKLAQIIDKNLPVLLPLLSADQTPASKALVIEIVSVSSKKEVSETYVDLYKIEKHATVLEALNLFSACYARENDIEKLPFEQIKNSKDKSPDYFPFLLKSIHKGSDINQLTDILKAAEIKEKHLPWFLALLYTCDSDPNKIAIALSQVITTLAEKVKSMDNDFYGFITVSNLIRRTIRMIFPDCKTYLTNANRPKRNSWFLLPEELTAPQKEVINAFLSIENTHFIEYRLNNEPYKYLRLPATIEGFKILVNQSESIYAQKVVHKNTEMPVLWAINEIHKDNYNAYYDEMELLLKALPPLTLYEIAANIDTVKSDAPWSFTQLYDVLINMIHENRDIFITYLKPKAEAYFQLSKEEREKIHQFWRYDLLTYTAIAFREDDILRKWLLENMTIKEMNNYLYKDNPKNYGGMYGLVEHYGNLMIEIIRQRDILKQTNPSEAQKFSFYITPDTDKNLVMGMLAYELFNPKTPVFEKLKNGKIKHAYADTSKDFTPEEMKPFYDIIPKEYFGGDKKLAFEKLWQLFLEDDSFKLEVV